MFHYSQSKNLIKIEKRNLNFQEELVHHSRAEFGWSIKRRRWKQTLSNDGKLFSTASVEACGVYMLSIHQKEEFKSCFLHGWKLWCFSTRKQFKSCSHASCVCQQRSSLKVVWSMHHMFVTWEEIKKLRCMSMHHVFVNKEAV